MGTPVNIGSTSYTVPAQGERGWGPNTTTLLVRLANVANQVVTSTYVLTADTFFQDVSGTYGLKANFLKGVGAAASADGFIRMASPHANPGQGLAYPVGTPEGKAYTYLSWRNSLNTADLHLFPNSDNVTLQFASKDLLNVDSVQSVSNKVIGATNQVDGAALDAGTVTNAAIAAAAAIALSKLAATTASRLLVSDASGVITPSNVTSTEAGYLSGVTSSIQTQLDAKQASGSYITALTGDVVATGPGSVAATIQAGVITNAMVAAAAAIAVNKLAAVTANRALVSDASGFITPSAATDVEVGYLSGVTSAVQTQLDSKINSSLIGAASGVAPLDGSSKISSIYLPSYVDDVIEVANFAALPGTGETGKIYITLDVNKTYRWTGSVYVEVSPSDVNSVNGQTGIVTLTSTNIAEGSNLYFTDERAQDAVGTILTDSSSVDFTYNDGANTITAAVLPAGVDKNSLGGSALSIPNGGTGQITAAAAFNALSPITTKGDLIAGSGVNTGTRLPVGSNGQYLKVDSTTGTGLVWDDVEAGGSGEKNYIGNPNSATNWVASGAGTAVSTESTPSLLPDNITQLTGIKVLRASGSDYARYRFTLDKVDYSKKLKFVLDMAYAGTAGDYTISVHSNTASDYTGTSTVLPVQNGSLPGNFTGQFGTTFDSSNATAPYIEVRVNGIAGTTALYLNNVLVGPGALVQGAAISEWQSYTPATQGLGTISITFAQYRRVGSSMEVLARIAAGTPTASEIRFNLPTGFTLTLASGMHVGDMIRSEATASTRKRFKVYAANNNAYVNFTNDDYTTAANTFIPLNGTAAVATSDTMTIQFTVPIAEWAGSGTLNMGAGAQVEYAYNSSVTATSDLTSFASGPDGAQFQNYAPGSGATVTKRVRFSTPIQNDDIIVLQYFANAQWTDVADDSFLAGMLSRQASTSYGMGRASVSGSLTDYDVVFANKRLADNTTYGNDSTATTWAGVAASANFKWRLKKVKPSSPVGFGLASATESGLMSTTTQTIAGAKTFSTSIALATSGGTPAALNYYEEASTSTTFQGNGGGATSTSVTITMTRVGRMVTMFIPSASTDAVPGGGSTYLTNNSAFPTRFAPPVTVTIPVQIFIGGVRQASPGAVRIRSTGSIEIYKDLVLTGVFTNGVSAGSGEFAISWNV